MTNSSIRGKALLISLLIFIFIFVSCWYALSRYESLLQEQQQLALEKNLSLKAASIAQAIEYRFSLLYGIRAYLLTKFDQLDGSEKEIKVDDANIYLQEIYKAGSDIWSVSISPGGIHQYIYPLNEKTQKTLGHNLLTDKRPHVRTKVQQTIKSGKIGLSGPYPLRQVGSLGLIARLPIYLDGQFWGFTVMVLNVPRMLEAGGITAADGIALRTADGNVFYGDTDVFEGQPLITSIMLPDGQWDFSISSKTLGLATNIKALLFILNSFFAFSTCTLFFFLYTRRWHLQLEVENATKSLYEQDAILRESEQKYRRFFSTINQGWAYHEIINDDKKRPIDYIFLEVNDAFEEITGLSSEEIVGKRVTEVWPGIEEDPARWIERYGEVALTGRSTRFDNYSNDLQRWFSVSASCPQLNYFITVFEDITERVKAEEFRLELEEQLRQKHKMEAVGHMAGGMAHNFNNNLSIILGNVELAQMKQAPNSEAIPLLENAKIAIRRSRDLVQKITTYSRKGIQNKTSIQLTVIVSETVALVQSTLPATVSIEQIINPECDSVVVDADASQIQEVLVNLCNNAVHAMDENGVLKILLDSVELAQRDIPAQYERSPGHYIKLSIQDTGSGISAEVMDKIFDPFFTTKEEYEGAGMGLATVHGIVSQHGGLIKVNSVPSQGTVFDLYLPIVDAEIIEPVPINTKIHRGTEQILLVDDDEMLASLGEELLSEIGYQVSVMTESTEALKMFTANADRFDLVITDQTMPELTGKDLILELKKIRPDIPTILCTGFSSKIDEVQAAELGINAFLMKPLDLPGLSQTVRRVLDGQGK